MYKRSQFPPESVETIMGQLRRRGFLAIALLAIAYLTAGLLVAFLALVARAQDHSGHESPPEAIKSRILVYQEVRAIRRNPIFIDGLEVASLRSRWSYFVMQLSPGEHSITGRHRDNAVVFQVSAGHDYFIRIGFDLVGEKPLLASCSEARLIMEAGKLHPIDPSDVRDNARVTLAMFPPDCREKK